MSQNNSDQVTTTDVPVRPGTLFEWIRKEIPVTLLDIRSEAEYESWHIDGNAVTTENIPVFEFFELPRGEIIDRLPSAEPLIIVCAKGYSSSLVAGWLQDNEISARNLEDGMEGWARVHEPFSVNGYDGTGTLYQYQRPSSGCLGYLLVSGDEAAVFDPLRVFTSDYREDARELDAELVYAFDTHVHADHISGLRELVAAGTTGVLPQRAIDRGVTYADEIQSAEDGDTFTIGEATVEVHHTPGHTTGMTSYLIDEEVLLTGDGLFLQSVARPDLESGDEGAIDAARQLYWTLHDRILPMSEDIFIAPGHTSGSVEPSPDGTYTAPLGEVVENLPLVSLDEEGFTDRVLSDMPPRPNNFERIIATNLGTESVDETVAFELELGPNNCATSH